MKLNKKLIFKALTLFLLCCGLFLVASNNGTPVSAKTCEEVMYDYYAADNAYTVAVNSRFYNDPTSCADDCAGVVDTPQNPHAHADCLSDCATTRNTNLASADLALWNSTGPTSCQMEQISYTCADANIAAYNCQALYDASNITDQDLQAAIYEQYLACRATTGVDQCQ